MSTDASAHAPDAHAHEHPPTPFLAKYVFSQNHKTIGKQFLFTSLIMMFFGGLMAMLVRYQLAWPHNDFGRKDHPIPGSNIKGFLDPVTKQWREAGNSLPANHYVAAVTMHASIMIFFVIIPLLVGAFANFVVPLQIGAKDMAFPLLNMLSYWFFWPAAVFMLMAMWTMFSNPGEQGGAGWTMYPPLAGLTSVASSPKAVNYWLISILFLGTSSIMGALNYITTVVKLRAPGLTFFKMPLTTWAVFITSILVLLATPVLAIATGLLLSDRLLGTSFYMPGQQLISYEQLAVAGGGNSIMYQHIFWFYSHPAVYIMILPAMGMASDVLSTFARKPIFGYKPMVFSIAGIAGLGFIVWGHHMFQSGMNPWLGMSFMISTMLIALPSAIKVFNWMGTLWGGNIQFTSAMLNALAFVTMFVIGGLSGIFMAATPVDIFIHDTYFIVAHIHYVLFGGSLFGIFAGLYFWYPKMFGRMMNEFWGKVHFILTFCLMNMVFFPMHNIGVAGHIRRISDPTRYESLRELQHWNLFISLSAFALMGVQIIFVINFFGSMIWGKKAAANPWKCCTLEWTLPSPAPEHNYPVVPTVYNGPYEYSRPDMQDDFLPQNQPPPTPAKTDEPKKDDGKHA